MATDKCDHDHTATVTTTSYLVRHKIVRPEKADAVISLQGVKMGPPSHVQMSIGVDMGEIASVRVGGESVLAGEGTLYL